MDKTDIIIIGAGVAGLAAAYNLSAKYRNIIVLEKEDTFGRHTSSRNSETIHSGIYYPQNTLKARLCLRGNELLYSFMKQQDVSHINCGKYIIATSKDEIPEIEKLKINGELNGVPGLRLVTGAEISSVEQDVNALTGVHVPSAGVMNSYELMKRFEGIAKENGVLFAYRTGVTAVVRAGDGYTIHTDNGDDISAGIVINCAGLFSDKIAASAGIDIDAAGYRLKYCKGEYYKSENTGRMKSLVYPVPSPDGKSLGIHTRMFTDGSVIFGPNAYYMDKNEVDYSLNNDRRDEFMNSVPLFMKRDVSDMSVCDCGIRPKLQGAGGKFRDFVIRDEGDRGLPGLINCIGIESPGLTSSLAIAEFISGMV
ncbi:MAG TPA: NAD(P)/FAD-dependent oxidoreductase [Spirochaetota bacterium]|nr:NAD(P)/FAD-dependent oxidoreductase [Spirochaetota bacterium]